MSPAFEKLIESQIAAGITGVVAVGTTGESPTLSHDEREQVIRLAVEIARGRCQVLAGTGSYSTSDAIAATVAAEKMGVDGALIVAPVLQQTEPGRTLPAFSRDRAGDEAAHHALQHSRALRRRYQRRDGGAAG